MRKNEGGRNIQWNGEGAEVGACVGEGVTKLTNLWKAVSRGVKKKAVEARREDEKGKEEEWGKGWRDTR